MAELGTNTKRVAYSTVAQLVGRLAIAAMGLVTLGATTRALGVDLYGQFTTAIIFIGLFATLTDAGISNITIRELAQKKRRAGEIVGAILILRTLISIGAALLAIGIGHLVYHQADQSPERFAINLLSLTLIFGAMQSTVTSVLVAEIRNDLVVIADVLGKLVAMLLTLYSIYRGLGLTGIALSVVIGALVGLCAGYLLGRRRAVPKMSIDVKYWQYILKISIPLGIAGIINTLYFRIDGFLLSIMAGSAAVAFYGVAYKLIELTMTIPIFFMTSIFPLMAAQASDPDRLNQLVIKSFRVLAIAAAPLSLGGAILAPYLANLFGGEAFIPAGNPMAILLLGNFFAFLTAVFINAVLAAGKTRFLLVVSAQALGINVALNLAMIPPLGTEGAALAVVATEIYIFFAVRHFYRLHIASAPALRSLAPSIMCAVGMLLVIAGARVLFPSLQPYSALNLIVLMGVGGLAYGLAGLAHGFLRPRQLVDLLAK